MTIVPASCLDATDFAVLGGNVAAAVRQERLQTLQAVNRSLAAHGESVDRLSAPPAAGRTRLIAFATGDGRSANSWTKATPKRRQAGC